jgi:hypothetical protein
VAGDLASTGYSLDIGWCSGAGTHYWNNGIDEVRIYSRALTATEIQLLYNQSK